MIRAVVFDVDGTLFNSQGLILEKTLECLERCRMKGIIIYLATARSRESLSRMKTIAETFPSLIDKGAFYGGAFAIDLEFGYSCCFQITPDVTESIINYLTINYSDIHIAIQKVRDRFSFLRDISYEELSSWGISQDELVPFDTASMEECLRIFAWCQTRDLKNAYTTIINQFGGSVQVLTDDRASWIQIQSSKATKENAILDLIRLRGIKPTEVCVFGDGEADIGMFGTFSYSVAMANAPSNVRSKAKFVTFGNDEDGISYAFERYLRI